MNWENALNKWKSEYHCTMNNAVKQDVLLKATVELKIPAILTTFYQYCNGLELGWFRIIPIEDPANIKKTWNGLSRVNNPLHNSFSEEFTSRFLIFSSLDAGGYGVIDRGDSSIWYEEDEQLNQTDLSLEEYIETCLKEYIEL